MCDKKISKSVLPDLINWETVLKAKRHAGGHEEVMRTIFEGRATAVAEFVEEDYSGSEAFAYLFEDGSVVIATDYFGSCCGCDSWENADDDNARQLIREIVNNSRVFPNLAEALEFCRRVGEDASDYPFHAAINLVSTLKKMEINDV